MAKGRRRRRQDGGRKRSSICLFPFSVSSSIFSSFLPVDDGLTRKRRNPALPPLEGETKSCPRFFLENHTLKSFTFSITFCTHVVLRERYLASGFYPFLCTQNISRFPNTLTLTGGEYPLPLLATGPTPLCV